MGEYTDQQNNYLHDTYTPDEIALYEQLLDLIAEALIRSPLVNTSDVENNQKFIRNGQLQVGQGSGVLALFQKDIRANQEDLNNTTLNNAEVEQTLIQIAINIDFSTLVIRIEEGGDFGVTISINGGGEDYNGLPITDLVIGDGNPMNVSQFIPLQQSGSVINVERAEEFLDTKIYELLPSGDTRQARINRFFQELNTLLPAIPQFDLFDSEGNPSPDGRVDRSVDGSWSGSLQYNKDNSISYAQDNPQESNIEEEEAFIHRLKGGAYPANDSNQNRTIEDIYNTILPYLTDILEDELELEEIPKYENQSSGYLKFRNLNQGIVIRNTNQNFVQGLDPNNPTWLTSDYNGLLSTYETDDAGGNVDGNALTKNFILSNVGTGFTITMWVRFLDKVSQGTLFNYGNPTRQIPGENPFGFKLETYVVNKDDPTRELNMYDNQGNATIVTNFGEYMNASNSNGENYVRDTMNLFKNTNSERFVRLQVREFGRYSNATDQGLRSSEIHL